MVATTKVKVRSNRGVGLIVRVDTSRISSGGKSFGHEKIFSAAHGLVKEFLQNSPFTDGEWVLQPLKQIRVRSEVAISLSCVDPTSGTHAIRLKIKPGDNATAWEYRLRVPANQDPEYVAQVLFGNSVDPYHDGESLEDTIEEDPPEVLEELPKQADPPPKEADDAEGNLSLIRSRMEAFEQVLAKRKERSAKTAGLTAEIAAKDKEIDALMAEIEKIETEKKALEDKVLAIQAEDEEDPEAGDAEKALSMLASLLK